MDFLKLGTSAAMLPDLLNEKLKLSDQMNQGNFSAKRTKDGLFKNQTQIFKGKSETVSAGKNDVESTKLAFEEFLKQKKDNSSQNEQLLNKNVRSLIKIKKDIFGNDGKHCPTLLKQSQGFPNNSPSKNEKLNDSDARIREIRRNGHKPYPMSKNLSNKCSTTEEETANICLGHEGDPCEHVEHRKCDCTYCEVFGTVHKNELLRDRLRVRLQQRREKRSKDHQEKHAAATANTNTIKIKNIISKVETRVPLPSSPTNIPPTPSIASSESSGTVNERDDISGLVNYIEGNTVLNKMEMAQKKAAKKARQRERREQEKIKAEEEAKRKADEAKRKEEDRKKELERLAEEKKKEEAAIKKKLKKSRQAAKRAAEQGKSNVQEETIPAMITIKRVNGNDAPNVTITLKGYTPDQEKLLYTLVKEPSEGNKSERVEPSSNTTAKNNMPTTGKKKKKAAAASVPAVTAQKPPEEPLKVLKKEVTVTLEVDKNPVEPASLPVTNNKQKADKKSAQKYNKAMKSDPIDMANELSSLGNFKLPPGITITKVEGPLTNRNYLGNESTEPATKTSSIVGKSGVIVVDTEKLIHKAPADQSVPPKAKTKLGKNKKKKKAKNKKNEENETASNGEEKPKMVTLKNPIFQQLQNAKPANMETDGCAPAAIFTSENGMVTIRSSRLQQSLNSGTAPNSIPLPMGMPLISNLLPEMPTPSLSNPNSYFPSPETTASSAAPEKETKTTMNAQEILSGLPGIEITKVDKNSMQYEDEDEEEIYQDAQVSIIPSGYEQQLNYDDLLYDNVFKPREDLEDLEDVSDPAERDIEAFKRFCHETVPPQHKEKVTHLNVADIVVKKKSDLNIKQS